MSDATQRLCVKLPLTPNTNVNGDTLIIALDRREERFRACLRNWLGDDADTAERNTGGLRWVGGIRFGAEAPPYMNLIEAYASLDALAAGTVENFRCVFTLELGRPICFMLRLAAADRAVLDGAIDRTMAEVMAPLGSA